MRRAFLPATLLLLASGQATGQQPPSCEASGYTPLRTAAKVIADVERHRCPAGSRLDVAMTIAGQAVVLQMSGICQRETVRTRTVRPTPDTSALGFRCDLAAR